MEVEVKSLVALMFTPITYRGYNYDVNTGLYYLQSRYYNPSYGRFLNADTTEILERTKGTVLGANIFAYCNNNPVMNVDYTGEYIRAWFLLGLILGAALYYCLNKESINKRFGAFLESILPPSTNLEDYENR